MPEKKAKTKNAAKTLSALGASKGGKARAQSLSPEERRSIASRAGLARWAQRAVAIPVGETTESLSPATDVDPSVPARGLPEAKYKGVLPMFDLPCYVLETGQRVIGRTSATEMLTGIKGGGALEKYIGVSGFKSFINMDLVLERMVSFRLPEVEGLDKAVKGLPADLLIDICKGMMDALKASVSGEVRLTDRQIEMAVKAGIFVGACAKVGLDALIDEATGYQYDRPQDALAVKLQAYIAEDMRKWEKTFPDELWLEFARLTRWKGTVTQRPKYWGKLVMELVYQYLDPDVAVWLKQNAPTPRYGQNYHQWLSSQYGLRKLVEHIWMLIGVSKTCKTMIDLKDRMAELQGNVPVQYRFYFPPPGK